MKKKLITLLIAFLMTFNLITCSSNVFAEEKLGAPGEYAYETLKYIDKNLRERLPGSEKELEASKFIKGKLESAGYEVTVQSFDYTNKKGEKKKSQNIIVTKPGDSTKEVVVGAHYDSVGTAGVDDNGSGTVVNLETAIRMKNEKTPYTVKFVFFGAEEGGLFGSKAYVKNLTQEQKNNIVYMVNMDTLLAGTYTYMYSGVYNEATKEVENAWPIYQAMEIAKELKLDLRMNNTKLNYHYPSPSTGDWSDHASFKNFAPYLYFEASNWEVLDDPAYPEDGSSGYAETETGTVMHKPDRDNLAFIEKEWAERGKNTLKTYSTLLPEVLKRVTPPVEEDRIIGDSRYTTATKISDRGWENTDNVVLVNSSAISDAISATPFAKMKDAPILLTDSNKLTTQTKTEITELKAKNVYVIGGNAVIADEVVKELEAMNIKVERIYGDNRYETSLEIANKLGNVSEIAVVNGETGLADAVSIAPIAAQNNMAIVLSSPKEGVSVFEKYIASQSIKSSYVIGKENAVSKDVASKLPNAKRLGGSNRNETNALVVEHFYTAKELSNVFVTKDGMKKADELIDALSVGVLAAKEKSPVVIVGKQLNAKQKSVFAAKDSKKITQVGGNGNEVGFRSLANIFQGKL